ncbi:beta-1,3-galactosyltransferase 5-like [Liolophura sinensis]|uniref:beta-1,3-galactosyltransferase 5-like n=1 Tax=Liolophura sinensis TaxID=3198878 RepID=UPI00315977BC
MSVSEFSSDKEYKNMAQHFLRHRGSVLLVCLLFVTVCSLWMSYNVVSKTELCETTAKQLPDLWFIQEAQMPKFVNFTEYIDRLRHDIAHHKALDPYFIPRDHKVNLYNYSFLIDGRNICQGKSPFLLIVVPSVFDQQDERKVIRETWGSVVKTGQWSDGTKLPVIKLMFLFGLRNDTSIYAKLKNESLEYGDVVLADFVDSYRNLTIKSMSALYWTTQFCSDAKYLLKNDADTIVYLPRLVHLMKKNFTNTIIGHEGQVLSVTRGGSIKRWIVSKEEYPPDKYPPYILGNFYAIPKDLISKLFHVSQYIPYLSMEDVFITGVVRITMDAELKHERACLTACKFYKTKISFTVGIGRLREAWEALSR